MSDTNAFENATTNETPASQEARSPRRGLRRRNGQAGPPAGDAHPAATHHRDVANEGELILDVNNLTVNFWVNTEWFTAADGLTYQLHAGEVLAIVGESGSGKTQSSMALVGLLPPNGRTTGSAKLGRTELVGLRGSRLRSVRGREIAVIFQEPMTALNPLYTVGFQIMETLRTHFVMNPSEAKRRA
ncbi:MAG TPA: ATP-binding cassette domain-containing protein, partial [Propionibacteriaceae bacterium]|nr:ATP-binding cassette domain-containing protein [Propionibacteriaceae bacterium]